MHILSWNIQSGRGSDNVLDLERVVSSIKDMQYPDGGTVDVVCLQEVALGFPGVTGGEEMDQPSILAALFPQHYVCFRPAVDVAAEPGNRFERWQFGCMVISRYPIVQVFNHLLTLRGISDKGMQRQALEVLVAAPGGTLRIVTTHLEFNSASCRSHQLEQLRRLQNEHLPIQATTRHVSRDFPYVAFDRSKQVVVCGDFNLLPDSAEYARMIETTDACPGLIDAWRQLRPEEPHAATCGWADPVQWPQGPHCRDYFFVSSQLCNRLRWVGVDVDVRASDHQPIALILDL